MRKRNPMTSTSSQRSPHFFAGLAIMLASLWVLGFANFVAGQPGGDSPSPAADQRLGIVVLTGGPDRIQWGMDALSQGRGERLLISGVNELTTRDDLRAIVTDPAGLFDCCVELDYTALNTIANADQAAAWAQSNGFDGLWVVTSYYHMPRTLLEFRTRAPDLPLYPLRVQPENYDDENWWRPGTFRILAWEYTKYELALLRVRLNHLF